MSIKAATRLKTKGKSKPLPNNKTLVTFKMDKDLKRQIDKLANEINVNLSTMINSLIKDVVRKQRFEISLDRVIVNSMDEFEQKVMEGFNSPLVDLRDSYLVKRLSEAKLRQK